MGISRGRDVLDDAVRGISDSASSELLLRLSAGLGGGDTCCDKPQRRV